MNSNGYIYIRSHKYYSNDNICKLGKTINILNRDSTYATSEYERGYFALVIEILSHTDTFVENLLQRYFKKYNKRINGGIEFYSKNIINKIEPFLLMTNIKFKVLTQEEIDNLIRTPKINKIIELLTKLIRNKQLTNTNTNTNTNTKRDKLQDEYVNDIINNLQSNNKVLVKAPTGFGKTIIMYKTINKLQPKTILILTPRLNLNKQYIETKYTQHLTTDYNYHQYSIGYHKKDIIKKIKNSEQNNIILCCYQSRESLVKFIMKYELKLDLIIFDESHFISGWIEKIKDENNKEEIFLMKNDIFIKNRIFTTATPIDEMILNNQLFGNLIEKVKIYELVNDEILCNIETIIKRLDNKKHEYSDLSKLIIKSMIDYNKKKGIVYVNNCANANNLYTLIKEQSMGLSIIEPYIYVSKDILKESSENKLIKSKKDFIDSEEELTKFENSNNKSIMIAVGKIGYGYDNIWVDFICFGDSRTSDIDIRQIVGRGLRYDKILYSEKILHILIPCYINEIDNSYEDNKALEAYMNYIISEYGNDNIEKIIINMNKSNNNIENIGKKYNGDDIPIEIYQKWCTTGYNMYSKFMIFLKINNIYDEISYNQLKEKQEWLEDLGNLQTKYPKFCFRHIHPNNINYYWEKQEALKAYEICNNKLINDIGKEKYRRLDSRYKVNKINELDKKIPIINFDLYYPKD